MVNTTRVKPIKAMPIKCFLCPNEQYSPSHLMKSHSFTHTDLKDFVNVMKPEVVKTKLFILSCSLCKAKVKNIRMHLKFHHYMDESMGGFIKAVEESEMNKEYLSCHKNNYLKLSSEEDDYWSLPTKVNHSCREKKEMGNYHFSRDTFFLDEVQDYVNQKKFTDIILRSGECTVPCHRVVLAKASSFLELLLDDTEVDALVIPDCKRNILRFLITLLYRGEIRISLDALGEFTALMDYLKIGYVNGRTTKETISIEEIRCKTEPASQLLLSEPEADLILKREICTVDLEDPPIAGRPTSRPSEVPKQEIYDEDTVACLDEPQCLRLLSCSNDQPGDASGVELPRPTAVMETSDDSHGSVIMESDHVASESAHLVVARDSLAVNSTVETSLAARNIPPTDCIYSDSPSSTGDMDTDVAEEFDESSIRNSEILDSFLNSPSDVIPIVPQSEPVTDMPDDLLASAVSIDNEENIDGIQGNSSITTEDGEWEEARIKFGLKPCEVKLDKLPPKYVSFWSQRGKRMNSLARSLKDCSGNHRGGVALKKTNASIIPFCHERTPILLSKPKNFTSKYTFLEQIFGSLDDNLKDLSNKPFQQFRHTRNYFIYGFQVRASKLSDHNYCKSASNNLLSSIDSSSTAPCIISEGNRCTPLDELSSRIPVTITTNQTKRLIHSIAPPDSASVMLNKSMTPTTSTDLMDNTVTTTSETFNPFPLTVPMAGSLGTAEKSVASIPLTESMVTTPVTELPLMGRQDTLPTTEDIENIAAAFNPSNCPPFTENYIERKTNTSTVSFFT